MGDSFAEWHWKEVKEWTNLRYDITHFVLSFLYAVLFGISTFMFARYQYNSRTFKGLLITGILIRCFFFGMQAFIMENILLLNNSINVMLNTLPSFFFFSGYMVLLFFWMQIYKTNQPYNLKTMDSKIWIIFLISNSVMFGTAGILYVLDFTKGAGILVNNHSPVPTAQNDYEKGVFMFGAILYILVSAGFFVYGYYALRYVYYENIEWSLKHLEARRLLLRRVAAITLVCMGCFIIRASITLLALFDKDLDWSWWLDGIYYLLLEIVPLLMMLRAYYPKKRKFPNSQSPLIPEPK